MRAHRLHEVIRQRSFPLGVLAGRLVRRPVLRPALLCGGLALLAAAWLGPLPALSRHSFSAHMAMHMTVVALVAPMLAAGVAGGRFDPVRRWPAWFPPLPASALEFVVVWGWHAPALHQAARHSSGGLVLEQASFLVVGLLVWLAAFGGSGEQRRTRAAAGISGLLLTSMHMTLLGVLLALAARPLYPHDGRVAFGLTPLLDQHLGGVLMLLSGGVAYLAGALVLLAQLLRRRREAVPHA